MSWLLLLVIFWKPLYWASAGAYYKYYKKEVTEGDNKLGAAGDWFKQLYGLIKAW